MCEEQVFKFSMIFALFLFCTSMIGLMVYAGITDEYEIKSLETCIEWSSENGRCTKDSVAHYCALDDKVLFKSKDLNEVNKFCEEQRKRTWNY